MNRATHWNRIYAKKSPAEVSWYQADPSVSLQLIDTIDLDAAATLIDVGGGASVLVDRLLDRGFMHLAVLDISANAIRHAQKRLGSRANNVAWYEQDVTAFIPPHRFDLWHDRAVFHFLIEENDRRRYVKVLKESLKPGGHAILATFAIGGPVKCSGLDIVQYDADRIRMVLGPTFELLDTQREAHQTPTGSMQQFVYFHFRRIKEKKPVESADTLDVATFSHA